MTEAESEERLRALVHKGNKLLGPSRKQEKVPEASRQHEENTSAAAKVVPVPEEKGEIQGSVTITTAKIELKYPGLNESTLELSDCEDRLENVETAKMVTVMREHVRDLGKHIFECGRELQSHTQTFKEKVDEGRWTANVEEHDWLKDPPECLKVKERTENMESRIKQLDEEDEIYRIKTGGRKVCLLIGNTTFNNKKELKGCAKDCSYLSALFKQLDFDVIEETNLTAEQIEAFLKQKKGELDGVECFVCAITSHGDPEGVLGSDRKVIQIREILNMFDRDNCYELANKPKLFLFDVCRGTNEDVAKTKAVTEESTDMMPPIKSDVLVAFATSYDYVSFCHPEYGSWFCRSFVKVVSDNACRYSILELLLMVNRMVGTFKENGRMQSAQFDCSMRKQFFFSLPVKENATGEQNTTKPVQVVTKD